MADGPVVTRKVGAAKRPAAEGAPVEGAVADGAPAGATQPLEPVASDAPGMEGDAEGALREPGMGDEDGFEGLGVIGAAAQATSAPQGDDAPSAPEPSSPTRRSVAGKRRASASLPASDASASSPDDAAAGSAADADGGKKKGKKRTSKRRDRRQRRKEAKAAKRAQMTTAQRVLRAMRLLLVTVAIIAVVVVGAVAGGISYHRWYAYDDALDIQGTWYVSGTDTPIEVTADTIVLTDDVAYRYHLDPSSKTITFSFGGLSGQGHYRFSLDRQYLVIFDGEYNWEQSLSTDVSWLIRALADHVLENPNDLAQGAFYNVTLLSRSSAEDSAVSASVVATPEGPRVVWSAADADGSSGDGDGSGAEAGDGGAQDGAAAPSGASDVDSLLGNLSDRPAG